MMHSYEILSESRLGADTGTVADVVADGSPVFAVEVQLHYLESPPNQNKKELFLRRVFSPFH